MGRKVITIWLSLIMMVSVVVIVDVSINITLNVRGATLYVNTTGSGGAYTSIQMAINDANPGDTVFVYNGTYYEHVVVDKSINLTGMSKDNTTINGGGSGDVLKITVDYVDVTGFTITNSGTVQIPSYDAGIELYKVDNCRIYNNNFSNNWYGIYVWRSDNINITGNIFITDGIFIRGDQLSHYNSHVIPNDNIVNDMPLYYYKDCSSTSFDGISVGELILANCSDVDVKNLQINNTDVGIHTAYSNNISIEYNELASNIFGIYLQKTTNSNITGNNISYNYNGITLYYESNDNTVANNTVYNNDDDGIYLYGSRSNHIFNNIIYNNGGTGIEFSSMSNTNTIYKNLIYNNSHGIYLNYQCNGNNIFDNLVYNSTYSGIAFIRYSNGNTITNNTVYNNNHEGIYLYAADANTISLNRVYENKLNGIILTHESTDGCANNKITNNSVLKNKGDGLHTTSRSNGNTIANNTIENNEDNGIYFYFSSGNTITNNSICHNTNDGVKYEFNSNGNTISENTVGDNGGYGIYLQNSVNNKIYHNDFINNTNQAFDDTDKNRWNVSYPSGGNYWSDFDEPVEGAYDDYNGPGQNISEGDGIVDKGLALGGGTNPYVIDSNSKDYYPLIQPYVGIPLYLHQGWNLISIPSIQSNISLTSVLQSINGKYDAVQWYNVSDQTDFWKHYHISKPPNLNDLNEITHKIGFWVHITAPGETVFLYRGTKPIQNQTIYLYPGWNIVGYPSLTSHNRTSGLNNITFGQHVDLIQWYDASTQTWYDMGENDYFELGRGYWVHANTKCVWEVPL